MYAAAARALPKARVVLWPQITSTSTIGRAFTTFRILHAPALTEAITSDHRDLEKYYREVIDSKDVEHQERYGNQFIWELARHSVAEELIVYPAMEKYAGEEGKDHAKKDREQHHKVSFGLNLAPAPAFAIVDLQQLKELLKTFQNMAAQDSEYVPQLKKIYRHLEEHIAEEEASDLPTLEKALSSDQNRGSSENLAKTFSRTRAFVPSRSHPAAGENPYIEGPAGLPVAIFDHIADLFRRFPEGKVSPNPSTK